jgi:7,8-dihydropterin-6-yl-methyl-4-(beta-D-ribofuranosyl)aminobenzene 5'-phosphate synthase
LKVTALIENRPDKAQPDLVAEWGLSLHIEFNGRRILFDTGISGAFARNAEYLGVDIGAVEAVVLSHHHYDHGGGLRQFLALNSRAIIHLGEAPDGDCYFKFLGFLKKYVGLDKTLYPDFISRFVTINDVSQILPDVCILPHISGSHPKAVGNKDLYLSRNGSLVHDDFSHEIVMAIKEDDKLVVFTGCSHNGILNAIDTVARQFPGVPIKAVIGGFHLTSMLPFLMAGRKNDVQDLGRAIVNYPIDKVYTGHCTGTKALGVLKSVMGEHLADFQTGSSFEV